MSNAANGKIMEKSRNRIHVRLVNNKQEYLKWRSKSSSMSHKIFDNYYIAIRKSKVTLMLNKSAYVRMFIFNLSKSLMYELRYDYIENNGNHSRLLFKHTDSIMYEIKAEDLYEDFSID